MRSRFLFGLAGIAFTFGIGCNGFSTEEIGSGAGAQTASPSASQKATDDRCFVAYSQAAGICNALAGNDDAAFTECLKPEKDALVSCCKEGGGSPNCAAEATQTVEAQKATDDRCFVAYSQAAGICNALAGNDDAAFTECLKPEKDALVSCCEEGGGSSNCAAEATQAPKTGPLAD